MLILHSKKTTRRGEGVKNCQFWDDIVYGQLQFMLNFVYLHSVPQIRIWITLFKQHSISRWDVFRHGFQGQLIYKSYNYNIYVNFVNLRSILKIRIWITLLKYSAKNFQLPKEWVLEKETKVNPWFLMVKHSEIFFFYLHIPLLCGSWDHQRILSK